jgi:hypothetical protein
MSRAPSAQLTPTLNGFACAIDVQNASIVCPDSVRPLRSVIVTEIITGTRGWGLEARSSNSSSMATMAALAFSVSTIVSTSKRSQPPSIRPRACSLYASHSSSNVMLRNDGLFTSGEIDKIFVVGPIEPATKRGLSGVFFVHSSAACRARRAPATFSS